MNEDLKDRAIAVLRSLSVSGSDQYREMWESAQQTIEAGATRKDKIFEVHHRIEMARRCFLESVVLRRTPLECKEHALMVITSVKKGE